MELDIDKILNEDVFEWTLTLKVAGKGWPVRPLVLADIARLQTVIGNADKSVLGMQKMVEGFFADPKPDVSKWSMRQSLAAVKAILVYWQKSAEKNSESVSTKVEAAVVLWMSGSSMPPS